MTLDKTIMTFYDVARSDYKDPVLILRSGQRMSALEVQVRYCEAARAFIKKARFESVQTEADLKEVVVWWEQALNALEKRDFSWMLGRFDWATKKRFGDTQEGEDRDALIERRKDINVLYHALGPGCLAERMNARWPERRIVTDEEIARAVAYPPSGTRAFSRASLIRQIHALKKKFRVNIAWREVTDGLLDVFLHMDSPLETYEKEVANFIYSPLWGSIPSPSGDSLV